MAGARPRTVLPIARNRGTLMLSGRGRWAALSLTSMSLSAAAASAQTVPTVQPPTREEIERAPVRQPVQPPSRLTIEGSVERAPCALAADEFRDVRFTIRSVAFNDLQGLRPEALRPAWQEFAGTEQPVAIICEIRDRAATILRNAGYIAAVEVPEQRIADGNVTFQVLMARLVGIRVRGDAGRAERTIAGYLERLTEQAVFNRFEAERYLLLAGDIPGYDVRLSLRSAEAGRGEVIGDVAVLRSPAELDFNLQNFGSPDLGRFGGLLRGQVYGLTGLGDRTSIALFSTSDFDEQQTLQIGHDFRLGSEGLTLSGVFTYAWAEPDTNDPNLRVTARTLIGTAEASYPFLRTQAETARAAFGFDIINQQVRLNGLPISRDRLRVAYLRLEGAASDPQSLVGGFGYSPAEPRWRLSGSVQARQGLGLFSASERCGPNFARCTGPGEIPLTRLEGDPTASVLRGEVYGEYRPVPRVTLSAGVRAQLSGNPLLSFEEFSAGNYTVGRGYDPGSLLGDNGVGLQLEARFGSILPVSAERPSVQPYMFLDAAKIDNEDRLIADTRNELVSVGAGLRSIYRGATLDAALAVPLRRAGLQIERPDPRFLISFTTRLFPWSF
jgi:hemolysin activation/secretion protein